eukprot:6907271-Alexandrium_andersonii.AAC.1
MSTAAPPGSPVGVAAVASPSPGASGGAAAGPPPAGWSAGAAAGSAARCSARAARVPRASEGRRQTTSWPSAGH